MARNNSSSFFLFFLAVVVVVSMPPSLSFHSFFFLSRIFLFLSLLVAVRRPCSSIYPLSSFFFSSYSNIYPQSNRHRPFTITSRFFSSFSRTLCLSLFSALHSERERRRRRRRNHYCYNQHQTNSVECENVC